MRSVQAAVSAVFVVAAGVLPARAAPRDDARQVAWAADYVAAREKARAEHRPLLVCFNMDGEKANDRAANQIFRDPEFVKLSREFVCVVASVGRHATVTAKVDGVDKEVCSRFGAVTCDEHRQCEIRASDELVGRPVVVAPQYFLLSAEGEVLDRRLYEQPKDELLRLMNRALGRVIDADGKPLEQVKPEDEKALLAEVEAVLDDVRKLKRPQKRRRLRELVDRDSLVVHQRLLEALVEDDDEGMRGLLAEMLARRGDFTLLEPLCRNLGDRDDSVSLAAADALRILGIPEATPELKKALRRHKSGADHGRVLLAYGICGAGDDKVQADLLKEAKSHEEDAAAFALAALHPFGADPDVQKMFARALKNGRARELIAAAWSVGMAGVVDLREEVRAHLAGEANAARQKLLQDALALLDQLAEKPDADVDELRKTLQGDLPGVLPLGGEGRR